METIRNRFVLKAVIFLTVLAVSFATVAGAYVFAANMRLGSYHETQRTVQREIGWSIADEAALNIMEISNLNSYNGVKVSLKKVRNSIPEKGIFGDEKKATKFGYAFYPIKNKKADKKNPLYILNKDLSKRTKEEQVIVYIAEHQTFQLEVYMEKPEKALGTYKSGEIPDKLLASYNEWVKFYECRYAGLVVMLCGFVIVPVLVILLLVATRRDVRFVKYVPLDLFALGVLGAIALLISSIGSVSLSGSLLSEMLVASAGGTVFVGMVVAALLLIVARMKQKGWWKSSLIYGCCHLLKKIGVLIYREFLLKLPSLWRATIFAMAFAFMNLLVLMLGLQMPLLLLLETVLIFVGIIVLASRFQRLLEGGKRIAEGDYDYVVKTDRLYFDMKKHAENLNRIRQGLDVAVQEQTKSERMRNELITNVSHDIKTPLTSIINYVDILKKELADSEDETIKEYLDVLDRQSCKLKRLTDDLLEASKAASGSIKMNPVKCDVGMFLSQVDGEYAESAQAAGLEVITKMPDYPVTFMLDGQSMYRVLSNLMGNICKYAQPGTRVYQTLDDAADKIIITLRNTSKYPLNISADELMERFVRGDSSRHTEGSGLGLNIARNLVELQGGKFDLYIDGDLFKVVITFEK